MTGPGLNSSIIETVSVLFEGGELKNAHVSGEIAFVNNANQDDISKCKYQNGDSQILTFVS